VGRASGYEREWSRRREEVSVFGPALNRSIRKEGAGLPLPNGDLDDQEFAARSEDPRPALAGAAFGDLEAGSAVPACIDLAFVVVAPSASLTRGVHIAPIAAGTAGRG
jgi:hypothetical protein